MTLDFLWEVFREVAAGEAIAGGAAPCTFSDLLARVSAQRELATRGGIQPGAVVTLESDYSEASIALLLALVDLGTIVVPLAPTSAARAVELRAIAQAEWRVDVPRAGDARIQSLGGRAEHPLYSRLRADSHAGLVLFSSGYTGPPKGAVHDWSRLLTKYKNRRHRLRTLLFLLFDHIGGIDTLLQALANGSTVVLPRDRTPEGVAATIERHRVEVLPAAPSFLTMLLLSEAHRRYDLSSLRYITYGAEVMPATTLERLAAAFPGVRLLQKYGLTELGTLRSHSRANDSLWVKVGGEGYETRVVEGLLQVKAASSMLGYLNAPSPLTEDGWFMTGDAVEVEGEYLRILGRASDLINVGGRKVYPAAVEAVIHEVDNVAEAVVFGERHAFTGQIVVARVALRAPEDPLSVERRIRSHCGSRLESYQVPIRVEVALAEELHTDRQKMSRR